MGYTPVEEVVDDDSNASETSDDTTEGEPESNEVANEHGTPSVPAQDVMNSINGMIGSVPDLITSVMGTIPQGMAPTNENIATMMTTIVPHITGSLSSFLSPELSSVVCNMFGSQDSQTELLSGFNTMMTNLSTTLPSTMPSTNPTPDPEPFQFLDTILTEEVQSLDLDDSLKEALGDLEGVVSSLPRAMRPLTDALDNCRTGTVQNTQSSMTTAIGDVFDNLMGSGMGSIMTSAGATPEATEKVKTDLSAMFGSLLGNLMPIMQQMSNMTAPSMTVDVATVEDVTDEPEDDAAGDTPTPEVE